MEKDLLDTREGLRKRIRWRIGEVLTDWLDNYSILKIKDLVEGGTSSTETDPHFIDYLTDKPYTQEVEEFERDVASKILKLNPSSLNGEIPVRPTTGSGLQNITPLERLLPQYNIYVKGYGPGEYLRYYTKVI